MQDEQRNVLHLLTVASSSQQLRRQKRHDRQRAKILQKPTAPTRHAQVRLQLQRKHDRGRW